METNINKKDNTKSMDNNKPKFDHISNRVDFIHNLLKDKKLDPLIDVKVSIDHKGGSDEQKKEYSRKRSGANNGQFGKKKPDSVKEKMVRNMKNKRKVDCFNLHNELIHSFDSIADGARKHNIDPNNLRNCCKGRYKTCGGFIWKFRE